VISVLVVGGQSETEGIVGRNPSVEILTAHGVDDALEKLGRNRRLDAVLLLRGADVSAILAAVREDNPAHPPIFLTSESLAMPGTRVLPATDPSELLDLVLASLGG
jgi:hypothetical protein